MPKKRKSLKKDKFDILISLVKDLITAELVIAGAGPDDIRKVLGSADNNKISAIKSAIRKTK